MDALPFSDTNWLEQVTIVGKVCVGTAIGAAIGWERESRDRPAGLRTHALLAAAATLLVSLGDVFIAYFQVESGPGALRVDPLRIIEAIITAVAFIGTGTIFRHANENVVEGLTTATSLLLVTALSIAVALEQLVVAVALAIVGLVVLRLLDRLTC